MKNILTIFIFVFCTIPYGFTQESNRVKFDFCGTSVAFTIDQPRPDHFNNSLTPESVQDFYNSFLNNKYLDVVAALNNYKAANHPDDWLFYQLIRRTAEQISPKAANYIQYTLFKWYLLSSTGYDALLRVSGNKILFYVQCDENIYNIPTHIKNDKQYVCLNYHDYGAYIDFSREFFRDVLLPGSETVKSFSYKIRQIPDFRATEYLEKDIHFSYEENDYHFKVKLSPQVEKLFNNYPVVDYDSYMNIPLSRETYNSLLPQLRKNIKGLSVKNGVDYLMRFTRYAFLFEADTRHFGSEKRLSPEQTLFFNESDCEDRVALFYYLVKEIYDLPMIVLTFPSHVTLAVQFDKPVGNAITYQGKKYTVCEPTPQKEDLAVGQMMPELRKEKYEVAYVYEPKAKK